MAEGRPSIELSGNGIRIAHSDGLISEYAIHHEFDESEENLGDALSFAETLRSGDGINWEPPTPSSDAYVWRYLSFTQLLSIIERESIWMTNVSQFEDPYEGTIPNRNIYREIHQIAKEAEISEEAASFIHRAVVHGGVPLSPRAYSIENAYVNCWNVNDHQSAALWEQYINSSQGVAIRTTVDRLRRAVSESGFDLVLGKVNYIDYDSDEIPPGNLPPIYHKRKSFEHEKEFRVAHQPPASDGDIGAGFYLEVDIDCLLDRIVISPIAPNWFSELVDRVLTKYDVDAELKESGLYTGPRASDYELPS